MMWPLWLFAGILFSLSQEEVANGQTILFEINTKETRSPISKITLLFQDKKYPFYQHPNKTKYDFYALVPISYHTSPQKTNAQIRYLEKNKNKNIILPINIIDGAYKSETLRVAPSRAIKAKMDIKRIKKESIKAKKIYHTNTQKSYVTESYSYPLESKITSQFGTKRVFNGILKSFHSGTDYRAKTGTPITAVNRGRVVLAKKRYFAGRSIILDHGQGIYSGYYHLSALKVKVGDIVEKGDTIGLVGATGRVTGPHLHFTIHVNGAVVDPLQFIETVNALY